MDVFNVEQEEHARRVARTEIGQRLTEIPLDVIAVEKLPSDEDDAEDIDKSDENE